MAQSNLDKELNQEELNKQLDELEGSDRTLFGWMAVAVLVVAVSFSLFHLYTAGIDMLPRMQQNAVHLAFALTLIFLIFPYKEPRPEEKFPGMICCFHCSGHQPVFIF